MVMFINKKIVEEFKKRNWELINPIFEEGDIRKTMFNRGLNVQLNSNETLSFQNTIREDLTLIIFEYLFGIESNDEEKIAMLDVEDLQLLNMVYREWGYLL